jgi:hypothetical protein
LAVGELASGAPGAAAIATVHTRNFRRGLWRGVLLATWITMLLVGALTTLGVPVVLAPPLLLGAMLVVIAFLAGDDVVRLTAEGFEREWTPLARRFARVRTQTWSIPFEAVRSYRQDRELSRSLQSYAYLEIDLDRDPGRLIVTDRHDKAGFAAFEAAFLARIGAAPRTAPAAPAVLAPTVLAPAAAAPTSNPAAPQPGSTTATPATVAAPDAVPAPTVRRRRSFYASPAAIVVAILLAALALVLVALALTGHLSFGSLVRLVLFIVPGTAYVVWRVAQARAPQP